MTDSAHLERRYRRLLAFYPKAFRREHEQELVSVLMAGAAEGQRRPRLAESVDLLRNGVLVRVRHTKLPSSWEYRHARVMFPVRVGIGIWLVTLTAILYGYGSPRGASSIRRPAARWSRRHTIAHKGRLEVPSEKVEHMGTEENRPPLRRIDPLRQGFTIGSMRSTPMILEAAPPRRARATTRPSTRPAPTRSRSIRRSSRVSALSACSGGSARQAKRVDLAAIQLLEPLTQLV